MKRERCIYFIIAAITTLIAAIAVIEYTLHRNEVWVSIADDFVFPAACTILGAITVALVGAATASQVLNSRGRTGGGTEARSASLKSCTYRTIVILTISATAIVVLAYIQYRDQSWVGIAKNLLFPLSYTVIGAVIVTWVGISIADEFLDHYNERLKDGLTNRKIHFEGDPQTIESVRDDLKRSSLINVDNFSTDSITLAESDLAILCIDKTYGSPYAKPEDSAAKRTRRLFRASKGGRTAPSEEETSEYKKWKARATEMVESLLAQIDSSGQGTALIVYTDGWFEDKTRDRIGARPFTALVNTRGRIVSDIHSLLTTLPPRS